MSTAFIQTETLTSIADAIRNKNGLTTQYKPNEMATAILAIETGGGGGGTTELSVVLQDDCSYRFVNGGWDFIMQDYPNSITSQDISSCRQMFSQSKVTRIPFTINCNPYVTSVDMTQMFSAATNLSEPPTIVDAIPSNTNSIFQGCQGLVSFPANWSDGFDFSYIDSRTSGYSINRASMFSNCYRLRNAPMEFINHSAQAFGSASYSQFYYLFNNCYVLDEVVGLKYTYPSTVNIASNVFSNTFKNCKRLKKLTFATDENGQPVVAGMRNQVIDLIGIGSNLHEAEALLYIPDGKLVYNEATYQLYKNDPDWFTNQSGTYSRYNHDSAVETINSLPDTSAAIAQYGGTNTIKFSGISGEGTDGGAINTLTEAEIAVATAKGWTVTFA